MRNRPRGEVSHWTLYASIVSNPNQAAPASRQSRSAKGDDRIGLTPSYHDEDAMFIAVEWLPGQICLLKCYPCSQKGNPNCAACGTCVRYLCDNKRCEHPKSRGLNRIVLGSDEPIWQRAARALHRYGEFDNISLKDLSAKVSLACLKLPGFNYPRLTSKSPTLKQSRVSIQERKPNLGQMTEVRVSPSIGPSEAKMQPDQVVVAPGSENENGGEDEQDEASQQSWATQATSLILQDFPTEAERKALAEFASHSGESSHPREGMYHLLCCRAHA